MSNNVTYQIDRPATPPNQTIIETVDQGSGVMRQTVKVGESALPTDAATQTTLATLLKPSDTLAEVGIANVVFDPSNLSAFGTLESSEFTPILQTDFVYGLNTQTWNTATVSGTGAAVDTNTSRLRVQSGTDSSGYSYITSRRILRYRAGEGTVARFTPIFTAGAANNLQLMGVGTIASNVIYDGYFFGFSGTSFGIAHYRGGSLLGFTAQASWNGDKCDGSAGTSFTLDKTFGTPAMIKYPYLGYGDILFFYQIPSTGRWTLCHTIRYANTTATTQLVNPGLQFVAFTLNSGNTTNKIMYCGSVGAFISGQRSFIGNPKWAADATKTVTTEAAVLNLKNCTTYNTVTNKGMIRLSCISVSNGGNNTTVTVRLKVGVTLGGSPTYTTVNGTTGNEGVTITSGNSIASYDTAATTVASGSYIFNMNVGPNGSQVVDLVPFNIIIAPTEILTISAQASGSSSIGVSINWTEDI